MQSWYVLSTNSTPPIVFLTISLVLGGVCLTRRIGLEVFAGDNDDVAAAGVLHRGKDLTHADSDGGLAGVEFAKVL